MNENEFMGSDPVYVPSSFETVLSQSEASVHDAI